MPSPPPDIPRAAARLARRLAVPRASAPWTPPPLPDLVARLDAAVAARRG